ncbi:TPA: hypothetical protein ACGFCK_002130 [Clostridium perfringens]|nr:hypothetical protein [Clostridium perfringens]
MSYVYFNIVFYVKKEYCYANSKANKINIYYKNMINLFKTIEINKSNNNVKLILFTNIDVPIKFKDEFNSMNVKIIIRDNKHIPPKGYYNMWQGTFFYLDAVDYFKEIMTKKDLLIMIDPDCLVTKDITPIVDSIKREKIVNYRVEYPFEYSQNGLSRKEIKKIIFEENNKDINTVFFGGEFYGFCGEKIHEVSSELEKAWHISLNRFENKKEYFKTEEHIFTYVFYKIGANSGVANKFLKRMWTAPDFNNIEKNDKDYIIWHLPAEKNRGLIKIYNKDIIKSVDKKDLQKKFEKIIGIPNKGIKRYSYDKIYCILKRILK